MVVRGVPFTQNWRGCPDEGDSWGYYLFELQTLFEVLWGTEGIVVISGDRHEHATILLPSPEGMEYVIEFLTSPLSRFHHPLERSYLQIEDTDIEVFSYLKGVLKFGALTFNTNYPW